MRLLALALCALVVVTGDHLHVTAMVVVGFYLFVMTLVLCLLAGIEKPEPEEDV